KHDYTADATFRCSGKRKQRRCNQDWVLIDLRKQVRSNTRGEHASHRSAERRPKVEFGQMRGRRTASVKFAMVEQRKQNKGHEVDGNEREPKWPLAAEESDRERRNGKRHQTRHGRMREPRAIAKCCDECEQMKRERQDPKERRRSKISRDVRGHRNN